MRMHITPQATALTLCLSLASAAAFAGDPPAAPARFVPPPPAESAAASSPPEVGEAREQAQMEAARRREDAARERQDALRAQMDAARRRMEVAAQQLAALSAQMYGPMMRRVETLAGPPHVLLGVQLDDSDGGTGALVREVSPGGAAEQAGVRSGDRIVAVDGTNVQGHDPALRVVELLHDVKPGDKVDLKVARGGKTRDLTVTAHPLGDEIFLAGRLPHVPPLPPVGALPGWGDAPVIISGPMTDMELARLTPGLGRYFGTDTGVLVVRAPPKGGLGLQDGDVILSIAGRKPIDSSHVIRILSSYDPGEKITLEVMRQHRRISVATTLPAEPEGSRHVFQIEKGPFPGPGPVIRVETGDRTR
jgi:C-terminal processing protease CtpA/Prc